RGGESWLGLPSLTPLLLERHVFYGPAIRGLIAILRSRVTQREQRRRVHVRRDAEPLLDLTLEAPPSHRAADSTGSAPAPRADAPPSSGPRLRARSRRAWRRWRAGS